MSPSLIYWAIVVLIYNIERERESSAQLQQPKPEGGDIGWRWPSSSSTSRPSRLCFFTGPWWQVWRLPGNINHLPTPTEARFVLPIDVFTDHCPGIDYCILILLTSYIWIHHCHSPLCSPIDCLCPSQSSSNRHIWQPFFSLNTAISKWIISAFNIIFQLWSIVEL